MTRTRTPNPQLDTLFGIVVGLVIGMLAVAFAVGAVVLFSGLGMGVFGSLDEFETQVFRWGGIACVVLALAVGWLAGFNGTRVGGYRSGIAATVLLVALSGLGIAVFRDAATAGSVLVFTSPLPLAMLAGALMGRKRSRPGSAAEDGTTTASSADTGAAGTPAPTDASE